MARSAENADLLTPWPPGLGLPPESVLAEKSIPEVVPTRTQPMVSAPHVSAPATLLSRPRAAGSLPSRPTAESGENLDLGQPVGDLHEGNEPVTWAGGSLELVAVAEHRPVSALDRDPTRHKWMTRAAAGSVGLVVVAMFALTGGSEDEVEAKDSQAIVEVPSAPEPPAPEPTPAPEPEPKKAKKKASTKRDSTLAAASKSAAASAPSKPASKPASAPASKPASAPASAPTSKPAGPNLAPPEPDAGGSKAELPDVVGWDDQDAAVGERNAEGV